MWWSAWVGQKLFEVFLVDWIPPAVEDNRRGFDAYVDVDLANRIRAVSRHQQVDQVSLVGYCFGASPSALYAAPHPRSVKT